MAESQDFFEYTAPKLAELEGSLSTARLASYLKEANGDRAFAIQKYLWNARLAKAFLYPLHVAEVVTRNAMNRALAGRFGIDWVRNPPFALTPESRTSLDRAVARLDPLPTVDSIVAALTFDFWSNLFRKEYDTLWDATLLANAFPHLPAGYTRRDVQLVVARVNKLRNRIAHHEPIYLGNHRDDHQNILGLIGWSSARAAEWAKAHSTVMATVRTPPQSAESRPGRPLASVNLRPPLEVESTDSLFEILERVNDARPPVALIRVGGEFEAVTAARLGSFVAIQAKAADGMVDLNDHDVEALLAATPSIHVATLPRSGTTGDVAHTFFPPNVAYNIRPQLIVVTTEDGAPAGVIQRPDFKY